MNILITGGAGYVGTVLIELLLKEGHRVTVLDTLDFGVMPILPFFRNHRFHFIKGDIRDMNAVHDAMLGQDGVIHLAAVVGYPACDADPDKAQSVNVEGTRCVVEVAGKRPVVFASTGSVYGKLEVACAESSTPHPLTVYGKTKLEAEALVLAKGGVVFRFATAFGLSPRLRLDLLPNDFTFKAIHEGSLVIYESGFRRTFIHVEDMARALLHGLEHADTMGGQVYNAGNERLNMTKRDLAEMIGEYVSYKRHYIEAGKDADQRDYEVNYAKLRETGFETGTEMTDGILELVMGLEHLKLVNPFRNAE